MKYVSTRGGCPPISFQEAILTGLAPDGGLYVPQHIPCISKDELQSWVGLSYPELAEKVVRHFISEDEISSVELTDIVKDSFTSFHHPDIIPVQQLGPYNIMELWHGPTGAFKDLAFALFARFVDHFLKKQDKKGVALVGTLGDTGSAAIHSFKNSTNVSLVILFPKNGCQKLQRLQMTTVQSPILRLYACDCPSDEFDNTIMAVFNDKEFATKHNMLWLNGVNTARFVLQTINYIYGFLKLSPSLDKDVEFYIPSGGFANAAGGFLASCMGVPIKLVPVVNENDSFYRALNTGRLERPDKVIPTYSCALDTMFPHNVERILYMLSEGDAPMISTLMNEYYTRGVASIPQSCLNAAKGKIRSERISQQEAQQITQQIWKEYKYKLCPHTAVAVAGATKHILSQSTTSTSTTKGEQPLLVCLATATYCKFQEFLHHLSIPVSPPYHPCVEGLEDKKEFYHEMNKGDNWEQILRDAIASSTIPK